MVKFLSNGLLYQIKACYKSTPSLRNNIFTQTFDEKEPHKYMLFLQYERSEFVFVIKDN